MSSSLVHQPQEIRSQAVPGMSRTTMPCSNNLRAVSAGSPSGTNETRFAWPGAVATSKRLASDVQQRAEISLPWWAAQWGVVPRAASSPASGGRGDPAAVEPGSPRLGCEGAALVVAVLREVRGQRDLQGPGLADVQAAGRVRAAKPFLTGDGIEVVPRRLDRDRAGTLGAVHEHRQARRVLDLLDGQQIAGLP